MKTTVKTNGTKAADVIPKNIDELYRQAGELRAKSCNEKIAAALKEHNCDMQIVIVVGENEQGKQIVPLQQILNLPGVVRVVAK